MARRFEKASTAIAWPKPGIIFHRNPAAIKAVRAGEGRGSAISAEAVIGRLAGFLVLPRGGKWADNSPSAYRSRVFPNPSADFGTLQKIVQRLKRA
jgi:hypothetical protein